MGWLVKILALIFRPVVDEVLRQRLREQDVRILGRKAAAEEWSKAEVLRRKGEFIRSVSRT